MTTPFWKPPQVGKELGEAISRAAAIPLETKKRLDEIAGDLLRVAALLPDVGELDEHEKQFMELMVALDWPPPLEVSLADAVELVKQYQQDPETVENGIDEWVLSRCTDDSLTRAVDDWRACPMCEWRMGPLEAAVRAHLSGEYFCSVPVLLSQTEGVICDFFGAEWENRLSKTVCHKVHKSLELSASDGISKHVRHALPKYYLDRVMSSLPPVSQPAGSLRRNLILHGGDCTYGTPAISWKSIILFDTIIESLEVAVVDGDDIVYHLPTCDKALAAPDGAVTYVHISKAPSLDERSPCHLCAAPELLARQAYRSED